MGSKLESHDMSLIQVALLSKLRMFESFVVLSYQTCTYSGFANLTYRVVLVVHVSRLLELPARLSFASSVRIGSVVRICVRICSWLTGRYRKHVLNSESRVTPCELLCCDWRQRGIVNTADEAGFKFNSSRSDEILITGRDEAPLVQRSYISEEAGTISAWILQEPQKLLTRPKHHIAEQRTWHTEAELKLSLFE